MFTPTDVANGEPMPFPYLVRAKYQFQIDGVIAGTVLRELARVAPRETTAEVALAAVDAVEASRTDAAEVSDVRRLVSLDALSEWEAEPATPWSKLHAVASRGAELVSAAGSEALGRILGDPLRRLAAA